MRKNTHPHTQTCNLQHKNTTQQHNTTTQHNNTTTQLTEVTTSSVVASAVPQTMLPKHSQSHRKAAVVVVVAVAAA